MTTEKPNIHVVADNGKVREKSELSYCGACYLRLGVKVCDVTEVLSFPMDADGDVLEDTEPLRQYRCIHCGGYID